MPTSPKPNLERQIQLGVGGNRHSWKPKNRGDIHLALQSHEVFLKEWPQSPRPITWLSDLILSEATRLTAKDHALIELLLASAYQDTPALDRTVYTLPIREALHLLGPHSRVATLDGSISRVASVKTISQTSSEAEDLYQKIYRDEETIYFTPGSFARRVIPEKAAYGYIELGAFASFTSHHASLLYRRLLGALGKRRWTFGPDDLNRVEVTLSREELASWAGYAPQDSSKSLHWPSVRRRAVVPALKGLACVRAFSTSYKERDAKTPLKQTCTFTLVLQPPALKYLKTPSTSKKDFPVLGPAHNDAAEFWIKPGTQLRIRQALYHGMRNDPAFSKKRNSELWVDAGAKFEDAYVAWLVALREALQRRPLDLGYESSPWRGDQLLAAIKEQDVNEVFWSFAWRHAMNPLVPPSSVASEGRVARQDAKNRHHASLERRARAQNRPLRRRRVRSGDEIEAARWEQHKILVLSSERRALEDWLASRQRSTVLRPVKAVDGERLRGALKNHHPLANTSQPAMLLINGLAALETSQAARASDLRKTILMWVDEADKVLQGRLTEALTPALQRLEFKEMLSEATPILSAWASGDSESLMKLCGVRLDLSVAQSEA
jgi:hypothetical protein